MNAYISPVPIHEHIQNKFLACTREVGVPILSQNIDLKYVVPEAKQEGEKCKETPEPTFIFKTSSRSNNRSATLILPRRTCTLAVILVPNLNHMFMAYLDPKNVLSFTENKRCLGDLPIVSAMTTTL